MESYDQNATKVLGNLFASYPTPTNLTLALSLRKREGNGAPASFDDLPNHEDGGVSLEVCPIRGRCPRTPAMARELLSWSPSVWSLVRGG
jgi:hypothetical protein